MPGTLLGAWVAKIGFLPLRGALPWDKQTYNWIITIVSTVINVQNILRFQKRGASPILEAGSRRGITHIHDDL